MGEQADLFERMERSETAVLDRAAHHAKAFLASLPDRPIAPPLDADALRRRLGGPLPIGPSDERAVVDALADCVEGGLLASSASRFFGWVIGGTLPVAVAAEWMTAAWDQNAAAYALSPAAAVIEEVCGGWLKELLGLPPHASYAFVTGCQMAHTTALAAARHHLLAERGINVETAGLASAPPLRLLTGSHRHESIIRAVRLLGLGTDAIGLLPCDQDGSLRIDALAEALRETPDQPTIVCLQAGDLKYRRLRCLWARVRAGPRESRLGACRRSVRPLGCHQRSVRSSAARGSNGRIPGRPMVING